MSTHNFEHKKITTDEFRKMDSEEKILKVSASLVPPSGKPKNESLESLINKIDESAPSKIFYFKKYLQAAAAIIFITISIYTFKSILSPEKEATSFGQHTEIILPDSTQVTLNATSKLKWNHKKYAQKRTVTLKGEAFFDVKKGNEFTINTDNGIIEVLGTKLNVYSRKHNFWVSCISGKVRVSANQQHQIIEPGEMVSLTTNGLIKSNPGNIDKTASWRNGLFHFEDTELFTIFDELERQFDISIQFNGDGKRKATIVFSNESLNKALDIICIPMELSYEIQGKRKITIFKRE